MPMTVDRVDGSRADAVQYVPSRGMNPRRRKHRACTTIQRCIGIGKQRSTTSLFLRPTRSTKVCASHSFGSWRGDVARDDTRKA